MYKLFIKPTKQKHSLVGHSYNNICGRSCYKINKIRQWTYCDCIKVAREKAIKENKHILIQFNSIPL